jgi:hypothetical protein
MPVDYYSICEDAIITLLKDELPDFIKPATKDVQVTKSDLTVLGRGHDYFAVLFPGTFQSARLAARIQVTTWTVFVDLFARYKTEATSWANFKAYRAATYDLFRLYANLNGAQGVRDSFLSAVGEPLYYNSRGNPDAGPVFVSQRLSVTIEQIVNRT